MEIIIFRNNEVSADLFKNQQLYIDQLCDDPCFLKQEKYGNFKELDHTKSRLDNLDRTLEKNRRAAAKYLNEYELIKILYKKQVVSRAYFKLYEMIYFDPIIRKNKLDCFFICEAPGGFIECVSDIRRKKNLQTDYISISKYDTFIKYNVYFEQNNLIYGDITDIHIINDTITKTLKKFPNGLDLITADGGFDVKVFVAQEICSSKLLLCEIYIALKTQKQGGTFIIKFFDMFSHNSIMYYLLLCSVYTYVKIIKPKSSRNCNSERYLICYDFKGASEISQDIFEIINNFKMENFFTKVFPYFQVDHFPNFINKLKIFNNIIVYEQIKTINESIKMVQNKDVYFQNLLLSIFMENKNPIKFYNVISFKNILGSRIKKCIDFLRMFNINIHQINF